MFVDDVDLIRQDPLDLLGCRSVDRERDAFLKVGLGNDLRQNRVQRQNAPVAGNTRQFQNPFARSDGIALLGKIDLNIDPIAR